MKFDDLKKHAMITGCTPFCWLPKALHVPKLLFCWAMPRETVQYRVRRFEDEGFAGLADADRPGRPKKLSKQQLAEVSKALRGPPRNFGLSTNIWDGKTLSAFIKRQYNLDLGVRQCQRLFRQLDFRLRKPRPVIAKADPEQQKKHKKNSAR